MEQQRPLPAGGLHASDLDDVLDLDGPCLTSRLRFDRDEVDAGHRAELGWESRAESLREQGADERAIGAVSEAVDELAREVDAAVVVADARGIRSVDATDGDWPSDDARWQPLPWFAPIIGARQRRIDHVLVVCDRSGAELTLVRDGAEAKSVEVGGRTDPIRKVSVGGWSQRRIQERAERVWRANADDVADAIAELVREGTVEAVLLGGEERAVALVQDSLPSEVRDGLTLVSTTRAVDGNDDEGDTIRRALHDAVARRTVEWLHALKEWAPAGDAVDALDDVVTCLRQSQVGGLLLADTDTDQTLRYVPSRPDLVSLPGEELPVEAGNVAVAAGDALAWAALSTGAAVRVVPGHSVPGPAAALLRWTASSS